MSRSDPIMPVQLSIRVFTVHVHYNPNKTVLICLIYYRNETFTYLYSLSPAGAVSVYLFIATVYSVANWYVYCRSIFHIGVCHTYCLFPLVIKIWKSSFFLHFSNISYVSKYFGIIIRKVNITSNVL